jgi:hypothetical protein
MAVSVTHTVDVDAYYNGTWNHVFENLIPQNSTVQVVMGVGAKIVSAFRFRFRYSQPATPTGVLTLCEVNFYAYAPTVTTQAVSDILSTTVTGNGTITYTNGDNATIRGFQYGLTQVPTWDVHEHGSFLAEAFASGLTGLVANTSYWIRAYATNTVGTSYGSWVAFTTLPEAEAGVTTEAASDIGVDHAKGNGTVTGTDITERGFEVVLEFLGTLQQAIDHGIAGFVGLYTYSILGWSGTLVKTVTEAGDFEAGAFVGDLGRFPIATFNDKLFVAESYTYRARATIGGVVYYGEYVAFTTASYPTGEELPDDVISPGELIVEPIEEEPYSPFPPEPEEEELVFPPWEWPPLNLPPLGIDPSITFGKTFGAYLRGLDRKEDWKTLREKCIIYQENMNQFALTVNHNMLALKNLVNDIIEYVDGDVYPSDLKLVDSSQHLTPLYQEEISPNGFKDIINDFRLKDVCNVYDLSANFVKVLNSLNSLYESDYRTEPISYDTMEYMDIQPTAKRMILQLGDMDDKFKEVRRLIILNFKRIFSYV